MAMRMGEEKWVKITPKPSKARDLEKIAIKNDWFRNRDHALTARLLMNWGLSKGELNHFAGMHSLIPKEAHAFIPKKHVEALIEAENPQKLIPPQVHTQENGNLLDYFRKLKPALPQNGVAAHIRGIREKTGIPEEEREIKTALLGKLFKRGRQNLSLKELGEVEEYVQQLNSYVKSLKGREKQESQKYLFGRINANAITRYIHGSKIANWQIKRAIAKAAEQTTLGRQLAQTRRGKFTKKAAALLAAAAIGFGAGTYRANVQQAALNQAKQGKPPITAPKTLGKGQTQKLAAPKPVQKPLQQKPTFEQEFADEHQAIFPVLKKNYEAIYGASPPEQPAVQFLATMVFIHTNLDSFRNPKRIETARQIIKSYENAKRPLTSNEKYNYEQLKAIIETIDATKKVISDEELQQITEGMDRTDYDRQRYGKQSLNNAIKETVRHFLPSK